MESNATPIKITTNVLGWVTTQRAVDMVRRNTWDKVDPTTSRSGSCMRDVINKQANACNNTNNTGRRCAVSELIWKCVGKIELMISASYNRPPIIIATTKPADCQRIAWASNWSQA